jgi:hypothetical protein
MSVRHKGAALNHVEISHHDEDDDDDLTASTTISTIPDTSTSCESYFWLALSVNEVLKDHLLGNVQGRLDTTP